MDNSSSEVDLRLLRRIATRDHGALRELYDRYSHLTYGLIMRILRSPSDAEDVLQETFVRVWSRADTYDALRGSPAAWLLRIARNRAIDRLRARGAQPSVAVAPEGRDAAGTTEPATPETPETALESHTTAGMVRTALATLTPVQRELIEAAFFEGYTHTALATRFGMPLGTVKTRIRAGLAAMRERLEQVT